MSQTNGNRHTVSLLDVFAEPKEYLQSVVSRSRWIFAAAMVAVFIAVGTASTYLVLRDEGLVTQYLEGMIKKGPASVGIERFEAAIERTRAALESPIVALYISVQSSISKAFHLAGFWIVLGGGCAIAARSLHVFGKVVLACAGATPVLILGTMVNYLLRTAFHELGAVANLSPVIGSCGGRSLVCFLVKSVDVFTVWYLVIVSLAIASLIQWVEARAVVLVTLLWAIVVVCSFLTDASAGWTL